MDAYGTHLPILKSVSEQIKCENIFEFGMGDYSTTFFAEKFKEVTAVEMQEEEWYKKMVAKKLPNHVSLLCGIGPQPAIDILNSDIGKKYSCIFVDGHGGNRWECINHSFNKTDVIVTHDTEYPGYNWHLVDKPSGFTWLDIQTYTPWTSVITNNYQLITYLCSQYPNYQIRC
jgi:hypothetical protein